MSTEENQTYAESPAECEELSCRRHPFLSATENNKFVSAGDVSVTVGFTEYQLVMSNDNMQLFLRPDAAERAVDVKVKNI